MLCCQENLSELDNIGVILQRKQLSVSHFPPQKTVNTELIAEVGVECDWQLEHTLPGATWIIRNPNIILLRVSTGPFMHACWESKTSTTM